MNYSPKFLKRPSVLQETQEDFAFALLADLIQWSKAFTVPSDTFSPPEERYKHIKKPLTTFLQLNRSSIGFIG